MDPELNKQTNRLNGYVIGTLVIVTIIAIILIAKPLSFFHVSGSSMYPTLVQNELVFCFNRVDNIDYGDIVAFEHGGQNMIKRVIGKPGDEIIMDEAGNVTRNGKMLTEEYVKQKDLGGAEIKFPYKVPQNAYFVLGDNRPESLDSRMHTIGSIKKDDIICKILFIK